MAEPLTWLLSAAIGPAAVGVPVTIGANSFLGWFRRFANRDDLGTFLSNALQTDAELSRREFQDLRALFEERATWELVSDESVGDIVTQIAATLPPRPGRTAAESVALATCMARAICEFDVEQRDQPLGDRILEARIARLETFLQGESSARGSISAHLDAALLGLADRLDRLGEVEAQRYLSVKNQLSRILDPDRAPATRRALLRVYLERLLVVWSFDPWTLDPRFVGRPIAVPDVETPLKILVRGGPKDDQDTVDVADKVVDASSRLVVLGGSGSGKTWLARRTARRAAERALEMIDQGAALDEVEIPLFTTCSRFFATGGSVRAAAVDAALSRIGDLGPEQQAQRIRSLLVDRAGSALLILDSLDEADLTHPRLPEADSVSSWRLVVTSRPSSWWNQISIEPGNQGHVVAQLLPLHYPDDVERIVFGWFPGEPQTATKILEDIKSRAVLRSMSTVPLILAFICIVGSTGPLPTSLANLHKKVIPRLLSGVWRGSTATALDADRCGEVLRRWAVDAAVADPHSGLGNWNDEFDAAPAPDLSPEEELACGNLAVPLRPADLDTGWTHRRFVHRSIRESLLATSIASLDVEEAVSALRPHLWFDTDWEYAGPAAVAGHGRHNELLEALLKEIRTPIETLQSGSPIDLELCRWLLRIAADTEEDSWSTGWEILHAARLTGARQGLITEVAASNHWTRSSAGLCHELLSAEALDSGTSDLYHLANLAIAFGGLDDVKILQDQLLSRIAEATDQASVSAAIEALKSLRRALEIDVRPALDDVLADARELWRIQIIVSAIRALSAGRPSASVERRMMELAEQSLDRSARRWASLELARSAAEEGSASWSRFGPLFRFSSDPEVIVPLAVSMGVTSIPEDERSQVRAAILRVLPSIGREDLAEAANALALLTPDEDERRWAVDLVFGFVRRERDLVVLGDLLASLPALLVDDDELERAARTLLVLASPSAGDRLDALLECVAALALQIDESRHASSILIDALGHCTTDRSVRRLVERGRLIIELADRDIDLQRSLIGAMAQTGSNEAASLVIPLLDAFDLADELRSFVRQMLLEAVTSTSGERLRAAQWLIRLSSDDAQRSQAVAVGVDAALASTSVASIDLRAIEDELGAERKSILKEDLVARLADDLGTERLHVLITCIERLEPTLEERTLCARLLISALSRGATPMSVTIPLLGELASAGVEPAAATNALLSALEKQPRWSYEILQQLDRLADVRLRSRVQQALIDLIRTSRDVELAIESARHLVLWPVTGEEKCLDDARAALLSRVPDCRSGAAADRLASVALEAMNGTDERESHEVVTDALLSARRLGVAMALLKRTSVTATRAPTVTNHLIELLTSAGPDVDAELAMDAIRACLELDPSGARRVSLTGMLMNWVADDLDSRTVIAACRLLWEVSADENTIRQAAAQAIERVPVVPANSLSLIEILLASNPDAQLVGQIRKRAVELVERVSAREQVERLHEALAALNERGEGAPIRAALLSRLRVQTDVTAAERIVDGLGGVVPHLESDAWVRQAVTVELMSSKNSEVSACLMKILCSLGPDLEVLRQAEILPIPATRAFLASIRSASDVDGWIALLPLLRGEAVTRSRTPS